MDCLIKMFIFRSYIIGRLTTSFSGQENNNKHQSIYRRKKKSMNLKLKQTTPKIAQQFSINKN